MLVVDIGEADAGVGEADEDLVALEVVAVGGGFLDGSIFRSSEDGEIVAHGGCGMDVLIGVVKYRIDSPCRNLIMPSSARSPGIRIYTVGQARERHSS